MFKTVKTIFSAILTREPAEFTVNDLTEPLVENDESLIIGHNECDEQVIIAIPNNPQKNEYINKRNELTNLRLKCERLISYFKTNTFYIFMDIESKIKLHALNQLLDDIKYDIETGEVHYLHELNERFFLLKSKINTSSMSLNELNST